MKQLLITLVLVLTVSSAAYAGVSAYRSGNSQMTVKHMIPHLHNHSGSFWYSEQYYYEATFSDGTQFGFSVKISNLGLSKGKAVIVAKIRQRGKKRLYKKRTFKKGSWSYDRNQFQVKLGDESMSGKPGEITLKIKNEKFSGTVVFKNTLKAWRPRDGRIHMGKSFYDFSMQAPRANVTADLMLADGTKLKLEGLGYSDHSYGTAAPHKLFKRFIRIRKLARGHTLIVSAVQNPNGKWLSWLYVGTTRRKIAAFFGIAPRPLELKTDTRHQNHYRIPIKFEMRSADANVLLEVAVKRLKRRTDTLKTLGRLERFVVSKVAQPMYYLFSGRYRLTLKRGSKTKKLKGTAMYVFQQLTK